MKWSRIRRNCGERNWEETKNGMGTISVSPHKETGEGMNLEETGKKMN